VKPPRPAIRPGRNQNITPNNRAFVHDVHCRAELVHITGNWLTYNVAWRRSGYYLSLYEGFP